MTTYNWSALVSGQNINFVVGDQLYFNDAGISAGSVILGLNSTHSILTYAGKTVTLTNFSPWRLVGGTSTDPNVTNIRFANGSLFLFGDNTTNLSNDELPNTWTGSAFADHLLGAGGNDTLDGAGGNDWLEGGWHNDRLLGSGGNDSIEGAGGDDWLDGGAGNDTLHGNSAIPLPPPPDFNSTDHDTLVGGDGNDWMDGGAGSDTADYSGAVFGVYVNLAGFTAIGTNLGTDTLNNIEKVLGSGVFDSLNGDANANVLDGGGAGDDLWGDAGNDTFIGGAGNDTLRGGPGSDTADYSGAAFGVYVNLAGSTASASGLGDDSLNGIENVFGSGVFDSLNGDANANVLDGGGGGDDLWGDAGNDTLIGGAGNDTLRGGPGSDTADYSGATAAVNVNLGSNSANGSSIGSDALADIEQVAGTGFVDTLTGGGNNDVLNGGAGNDTLSGNAGNDTLDGGAGADTTYGGVGDDFYAVDAAGDVAAENPGEGTADLVRSSVNYTLAANVERLELIGAALTGTGNSENNVLTGNAWNNTLSGSGGNDTLNGGAGTDSLAGGAGNDAYVVSVSAGVGGSRIVFTPDDVVTESAGQGGDTIYSSSSYTLPGEVENLVLTGVPMWRAYEGHGNTLANLLTTTGAARQRLYGEGGNDTLDGGAGPDSLSGGSGADVFLFSTAPSADAVLDFTSGSDDINLENAIFTAFVATGAVSAARVQVGLQAAISATSGNDADGQDNLKYATDTGNFYYDSNGTAAGGLSLIATLYSTGTTPATLLPAQDIVII